MRSQAIKSIVGSLLLGAACFGLVAKVWADCHIPKKIFCPIPKEYCYLRPAGGENDDPHPCNGPGFHAEYDYFSFETYSPGFTDVSTGSPIACFRSCTCLRTWNQAENKYKCECDPATYGFPTGNPNVVWNIHLLCGLD